MGRNEMGNGTAIIPEGFTVKDEVSVNEAPMPEGFTVKEEPQVDVTPTFDPRGDVDPWDHVLNGGKWEDILPINVREPYEKMLSTVKGKEQFEELITSSLYMADITRGNPTDIMGSPEVYAQEIFQKPMGPKAIMARALSDEKTIGAFIEQWNTAIDAAREASIRPVTTELKTGVTRPVQDYLNKAVLNMAENARPSSGTIEAVSLMMSPPVMDAFEALDEDPTLTQQIVGAAKVVFAMNKEYFSEVLGLGDKPRATAQAELKKLRPPINFEVSEPERDEEGNLTTRGKFEFGSDIGTTLGAFVTKILLAKKIVPPGTVISDVVAWEMVGRADGQVPGMAAMTRGSLGAIGTFPTSTALGKAAKVASESSLFVGLTTVAGGDTTDKIVAGLLPVAFNGWNFAKQRKHLVQMETSKRNAANNTANTRRGKVNESYNKELKRIDLIRSTIGKDAAGRLEATAHTVRQHGLRGVDSVLANESRNIDTAVLEAKRLIFHDDAFAPTKTEWTVKAKAQARKMIASGKKDAVRKGNDMLNFIEKAETESRAAAKSVESRVGEVKEAVGEKVGKAKAKAKDVATNISELTESRAIKRASRQAAARDMILPPVETAVPVETKPAEVAGDKAPAVEEGIEIPIGSDAVITEKAVEQKLGIADISETSEADPDVIQPLHEPGDQQKLEALTNSMKDEGWQGRPILVIDADPGLKAFTGSHRLQAAIDAGLENIPIYEIDADKVDTFLAEPGNRLRLLNDRGDPVQGDETMLPVLEEVGDQGAVDLLRLELGMDEAPPTPKQEAGKEAPPISQAGGITSEKVSVSLRIGNITPGFKKRFAKATGEKVEDIQGFKEGGFPTNRTDIELTRGSATTLLNDHIIELERKLESNEINTEADLVQANILVGDIKALQDALGLTVKPAQFVAKRAKKQRIALKVGPKVAVTKEGLIEQAKKLGLDVANVDDELKAGLQSRITAFIESTKSKAQKIVDAAQAEAEKKAVAELSTKQSIEAGLRPDKLETVKMTTLEFFNQVMKGKSQAAQKAFTAAGRDMVKQHKNLAAFAREELSKADATKGEINRVLNAISRARTETEQIKAMATVAAITEKAQKRAVAKRINQDVPDSVDFFYREAIELLREGIDTRFRSDKTVDSREATRKFLDRNPDLVADMPVKLIKKLNQKPISEFTVAELNDVADAIDNLVKQGKLKRKLSLAQKARRFTERLTTMVSNITKGTPIDKSATVQTSLTKTGLVIPKIQAARAVTLRPSRLFDKLDRGKSFVGEISEFFVRQTNRLTDKKFKATDKRKAAMKAKQEELGISNKDLSQIRIVNGERYTVDDMIDIYAKEKNPLAKLAVIYGNNIPEADIDAIIAQLSKKEKALGDAVIEEYDENYPRVREAAIRTDNIDPGHQVNYTPIRREDASYNDHSEEIKDAILRRANLKTAFVEHGFTTRRKENIPAEFQKKTQLGIMKMWQSQVAKQEEYIHLAEHIKDMHHTRKSTDFRNAVEQNFGESYNEVIKGYVNRVANPNIYRTFGLIENTSRQLRKNTAIAYLAYNLVTMAKQLPSVLLYLGDAGPQHLLASAMQFVYSPISTVQEVRELDPQVKHKSIERELQELRQAGGNVVTKVTQAVGDFGMQGIHLIDTVARTIGWNAVYQKALASDKSHEEAVRLAQEATLRTQPTAAAKDLPEIYATSEFLNWFTMFTNQLNQIYNIATYDIPSYVKNEKYGTAALSAIGMALTALAIWAISHKKLPEDKEELADAATEQFINAIPLLGKAIMVGKRGWGDSGIPAFASGTAIGRSMAAIRRGEFTDYDVKVVTEAIAVTFGVPYIGPKRVIEFIQTGNPSVLLGGKQTTAPTRRINP